MKIEDNRKPVYFVDLEKGTVFITDKYPNTVLMKIDEDRINGIDLETGYGTKFNDYMIVKPLNAKLVIED